MEARELRIRNLVSCEMIGDTYTDRKPYYGKFIFDVAEIGVDRCKLSLGFDAVQVVMYDEISPIPLTEEWLVRFGFEEKTYVNGDGDEFNWWSLHGFSLNDGFQLTGDNGTSESMLPYKLEYVHQLQNLFFALTGEELTPN